MVDPALCRVAQALRSPETLAATDCLAFSASFASFRFFRQRVAKRQPGRAFAFTALGGSNVHRSGVHEIGAIALTGVNAHRELSPRPESCIRSCFQRGRIEAG